MAVRQQIPSSTNAPKTMQFAKLKGVDYSTSPFEVNPSRAVDMRNIINDDGINHKRPGWSENTKINQKLATEFYGQNVIGVFKEGNMTVVVLTYKILLFSYENLVKSQDIEETIGVDFSQRRSEVVLYCYSDIKTEIYIVNLQYSSIKQSQTYIPTTTISINSIDKEESTRASQDFANLLNIKRTNTMLGNTESDFKQLYITIDNSNISSTYFANITLYMDVWAESDYLSIPISSASRANEAVVYNSKFDSININFVINKGGDQQVSKMITIKVYDANGEEISNISGGGAEIVSPIPIDILTNNRLKVALIMGGES